MDIESRFLKTVAAYGLLKKGDSVLITLSGGPDSVTLLHLLYGLRDEYRLNLAAAHLDHAIRPSSSKDREFCRNLCLNLKIKFYSRRIDITKLAKKEKSNLEETGRKARYAYFDSICTRYGYEKIATGHTMDDNAETILFNLTRGAGLKGLAGIPVKRGKIIRPLIEVGKSELVNWLKTNKIAYRFDRTNRSVKYARNRIRNSILPELEKINPRIAESLWRFSRIVSQDIELMEKVSVLTYEKALLSEDKSKIVLDLGRIAGYDKNLVQMALTEAFYRLGGVRKRPSFEIFSRVKSTLTGKSGGKSSLGRGIWIEKSQNRISIFKEVPGAAFKPIPLVIPGITNIDRLNLRMESRLLEKRVIRSTKTQPSVALLDYNKTKKPVIRLWRRGDRIRPLGMKGTKLLSDLFLDKKIPTFERRQIPLVVSGNSVAWVAGVAVSEDFKVEAATQQILRIELCGL